MKKRYIILTIIIAFFSLFLIQTKCKAADLDRITNYEVTVEPRMNDGSLDITYEITWMVIDGTTEGPLTWVQIGTPNEYFDTPTALSDNIKSIKKYSGSYVRIDFDKTYQTGESVTFKYSIHQPYMHKVSWGNCKYEFTPAWFTDIRIELLTVRWNGADVKSSNSKKKDGVYLIWEKVNMQKGEKLEVKVKYDKKVFSSLITKQVKSNNDNTSYYYFITVLENLVPIIAIILMVIFRNGGGRRILPDTEDFMEDIEEAIMEGVYIQAVHVLTQAVQVVAPVPVLEAVEQDVLKRISMELI